jgi:hypothetical protein
LKKANKKKEKLENKALFFFEKFWQFGNLNYLCSPSQSENTGHDANQIIKQGAVL